MKNFKIWSITFFFVPLFLAIYFKIWISVAILITVIISSILYHSANEKKYATIDNFLAWILIFTNLYISYLGNFYMPHFSIALIFVLLSFYFIGYGKKKYGYNLSHGIWHICSSLITVLSILTFRQI